jgi:hypothetical protein
MPTRFKKGTEDYRIIRKGNLDAARLAPYLSGHTGEVCPYAVDRTHFKTIKKRYTGESRCPEHAENTGFRLSPE